MGRAATSGRYVWKTWVVRVCPDWARRTVTGSEQCDSGTSTPGAIVRPVLQGCGRRFGPEWGEVSVPGGQSGVCLVRRTGRLFEGMSLQVPLRDHVAEGKDFFPDFLERGSDDIEVVG